MTDTSRFGAVPIEQSGSRFGAAPVEQPLPQGRVIGGEAPVIPESSVLGPQQPVLKGYVKDPVEDKRAYELAAEQYAMFKPGLGDRLVDNMTLGISGPAGGVGQLISGALSGDPKMSDYQFGKAVNQYLTDMRDEATSGALGTTADVAGSLMTGGPAQSMVMGTKGILGAMATGGGLAAVDAMNNTTEGTPSSAADVAKQALAAALITGGAHKVGKAITPAAGATASHIPSPGITKKILNPSNWAGLAITATAAPYVTAVAGLLGMTTDAVVAMLNSKTGSVALEKILEKVGPGLISAAPQIGSEAGQGAVNFSNSVNDEQMKRNALIEQLGQ